MLDSIPGLRDAITEEQQPPNNSPLIKGAGGVSTSIPGLGMIAEALSTGRNAEGRENNAGGDRNNSPLTRGEGGVSTGQPTPTDPTTNQVLDLIPNLRNQLGELTQEMYPTNPMSAGQVGRLGELTARQRRLAPVRRTQFGEVGSPANPNNPFSIDSRSLNQGISNLAKGIGNKIRGNRRDSFAGELTQLSNQYQTNQQNTEAAQEFFKEFFPDLFDQTSINMRADADRASRESIADANNAADINIQQLKNTFARDPNNPETQKMYISGINNYVKAANPGLELIPNQIDNILRSVNYEPGPEEKRMIEELERQYAEQSQRAAKMYRDLGVVPGGNNSDLRDPTDEEFENIATMHLRKVPQEIITRYARDLGLNYIPPDSEINPDNVTVDPDRATTDNTNPGETDLSNIFGE